MTHADLAAPEPPDPTPASSTPDATSGPADATPGPSDAASGAAGAEPAPPPLTARALTLAVATVATALLVAVAGVLPVPYAIHSPGPTLDTLGEEDGVPLISVSGAPTFEPTGQLRLTTVRVGGGPGYPVSLVGTVVAWFDPERSVAPVESVFGPQDDREQIDERNQAAMISSQEHATVAALEELGYEVPTVLLVDETMEGSGASEVLRSGDVITAVEGEPVPSFSALSAAMDAQQPGSVVTVEVERDGAVHELEVTTIEDGDRALLGVYIDPEFDFPIDVQIQIQDVGGPSAGTMFALGIIDLLTEEDETGGQIIAGTGTVDLTGDIGPIGGIRQKLAGSADDGATWFLAPVENCGEVSGHVPDGLGVVAVDTLEEARAAVEAIGSGDTEGLATC